MIEAIIFDVDGTLYNETDAKIKAELLTAQFISEHSQYSRNEVYFAYLKSKAEIIEKYDSYTVRNDRVKWYKNALEKLKISNITPIEASNYYWDIVLDDIEPYLDLTLVIDELAKNYDLYILTDEFLEIQIKKLNRLGLKDYFCEIVSSEINGKTKPDRELFEYMLDLVGKPAKNVAMIGDNPKADMIGANQVGIHSIWLKRGKYHYYSHSNESKAELTIHNYLELVDKLSQIR